MSLNCLKKDTVSKISSSRRGSTMCGQIAIKKKYEIQINPQY